MAGWFDDRARPALDPLDEAMVLTQADRSSSGSLELVPEPRGSRSHLAGEEGACTRRVQAELGWLQEARLGCVSLLDSTRSCLLIRGSSGAEIYVLN